MARSQHERFDYSMAHSMACSCSFKERGARNFLLKLKPVSQWSCSVALISDGIQSLQDIHQPCGMELDCSAFHI